MRFDQIPRGWVKITLGDVASWGSGGTPSRSNSLYFGGSVPWFKTGELGPLKIFKSEENITKEALLCTSAKLFPAGSVVLAMYGATIGKVSILGVEAATNQACAVGIPKKFLVNTQYLYHYLRGQRDRFLAAGQGGAQPNISQAIVKGWCIPLAPMDEQKRIADKLDTIINRVDSVNARLARITPLLKRFRQSVLAAATSGRLTEDWREGNKITSAWTNHQIGDLLIEKPRNGYSPKAVDQETSVRSLTLSATTSGRFCSNCFKYIPDDIPENSHLWLKKGDVLIQRANSLGYVGVSAVVDVELDGYIYPDLMMKCRANEKTSSKFLHLLLSSEDIRKYFRENATGTAGNMPKINQKTVMSAPCRLPDLAEQGEILRRVEVLSAFADRVEIHLQVAQTSVARLTPSLLAKAFRGELVPQDPADEPATELLKRLAEARPASNVAKKRLGGAVTQVSPV